ncbi:MAG: uroporphyrinogen decarboxylase family protein [Victivallales bacterium]
MKKLTSKERFKRMFEHKEADRVPVIDIPWTATVERWRREGMPANADYVEFFGLDSVFGIGTDNSPRFEEKVIEETDEYKIYTTKWGVTLKNWKHMASTPEFLDFTIIDPESWKKAKERIRPEKDRIDWKALEKSYKEAQRKGSWTRANLWFGFDVTHSWIIGTERMLIALVENPDWCMDMFDHLLDVNLKLLDMVWEAGYRFDSVFWPDDMGYKHNQFFSLDMYRNLLRPFHKKAVDWAHRKGVKAHLHSCGDINPLVSELIDIGLDALNPLEVKAGMEPIVLKEKYGDKLVLHGGINAQLWDKPDEIKEEMERVIPVLKKNGGYIFSSDHSVPDSVSLKEFKQIIALAEKLGAY